AGGRLPRAECMVPALLVFVLVLLAVNYLSSLAHEVGHALLGRLAGFQAPLCGMGTGGPVLALDCCGTRLYLARDRPWQGLCFLLPDGLVLTGWRLALTLAGGIVVHLLLTLAGLAGWWLWPGATLVWAAVVLVNGAYAAVNLVPMSVRVGGVRLASD